MEGKDCDNKQKQNVVFSVALVSSLLVFIAILLLLSYTLLAFVQRNRIEGYEIVTMDQKGQDLYKHLRYNEKTREKSIGMASLNEIEEKDLPMYYKDGEGNHYLISDFGQEQYVLHGSCFCEMNERKSVIFGPTSRTLTYLVGATSTLFALQLAKEHFQKECEVVLKDDCSDGIIRADHIESDDGYEELKQWEGLYDVRAEPFDPEKDDRPGFSRYLCKGHCKPDYWKNEHSDTIITHHKGKTPEAYGHPFVICDEMDYSQTYSRRYKHEAERWFIEELHIHCKRKSMIALIDGYADWKKFTKGIVYEMEHESICVGYRLDGDLKFSLLKEADWSNAKCVQTSHPNGPRSEKRKKELKKQERLNKEFNMEEVEADEVVSYPEKYDF